MKKLKLNTFFKYLGVLRNKNLQYFVFLTLFLFSCNLNDNQKGKMGVENHFVSKKDINDTIFLNFVSGLSLAEFQNIFIEKNVLTKNLFTIEFYKYFELDNIVKNKEENKDEWEQEKFIIEDTCYRAFSLKLNFNKFNFIILPISANGVLTNISLLHHSKFGKLSSGYNLFNTMGKEDIDKLIYLYVEKYGKDTILYKNIGDLISSYEDGEFVGKHKKKYVFTEINWRTYPEIHIEYEIIDNFVTYLYIEYSSIAYNKNKELLKRKKKKEDYENEQNLIKEKNKERMKELYKIKKNKDDENQLKKEI
jgi:hypothetical protein